MRYPDKVIDYFIMIVDIRVLEYDDIIIIILYNLAYTFFFPNRYYYYHRIKII